MQWPGLQADSQHWQRKVPLGLPDLGGHPWCPGDHVLSLHQGLQGLSSTSGAGGPEVPSATPRSPQVPANGLTGHLQDNHQGRVQRAQLSPMAEMYRVMMSQVFTPAVGTGDPEQHGDTETSAPARRPAGPTATRHPETPVI